MQLPQFFPLSIKAMNMFKQHTVSFYQREGKNMRFVTKDFDDIADAANCSYTADFELLRDQLHKWYSYMIFQVCNVFPHSKFANDVRPVLRTIYNHLDRLNKAGIAKELVVEICEEINNQLAVIKPQADKQTAMERWQKPVSIIEKFTERYSGKKYNNYYFVVGLHNHDRICINIRTTDRPTADMLFNARALGKAVKTVKAPTCMQCKRPMPLLYFVGKYKDFEPCKCNPQQ